MFRHGARAPWSPNGGVDPITKKDILGEVWDHNPGDSELTPMGIRQQYLLGYQLRSKYVDQLKFLSSSYTPTEILIFSTDINRTIMSAQSQLFGLYPPSTGPVILDSQQTKAVPPIPITNLPSIITQLGLNSIPDQSQIFPIHLFDPKFISLQDVGRCPRVNDYKIENKKRRDLRVVLEKFNKKYYEKLKTVLDFVYTETYLLDADNVLLLSMLL